MKDIKFYDTNSLLLAGESAFKEKFVISSITLEELEYIKISSDNSLSQLAITLSKLLKENSNKYEVIFHVKENEERIRQFGFAITDNVKILSDALYYDAYMRPDETIFVTNSSELQCIANYFLGEDSIILLSN